MTIFVLLSVIVIAVSVWLLCTRLINGAGKWLALALSISIPAATALIYQQVGTPKAIDVANTTPASGVHSAAPTGQTPNLSAEQLDKAIVALEQQLQSNPQDQDKLTMLANSYLLRERFADSARVLEQLITLRQDADLKVKAADAYAMANGGRITPRASELIRQALTQQPNQPQALWLAGMEAAQTGDFASAKTFWQRLKPLLASAPRQQQELEQLIQQMDRELGAPQQATTSDDTTSDQSAQTNDKPAGRTIVVDVKIAEGVQGSVQPSDTVFVFAKAASGPPAPLAVKRLTVADLPASVTLTEQDAMMPQLSIANFPEVVLSAKVSKSGNPTITDGDITSNTVDIRQTESVKSWELVIGQP